MMHLTESQVRSVLVKHGMDIHGDSKVLIGHFVGIANDMVALYLATHQQPAAPVMPGQQMGMF